MVSLIEKLCYMLWAIGNVDDDKSVVCLMNEKAKITPQKPVYYMEPDFTWRQECYQALLYNREMPPVPKDDPEYYRKKIQTDLKRDSGLTPDMEWEARAKKLEELLSIQRKEEKRLKDDRKRYQKFNRLVCIIAALLFVCDIFLVIRVVSSSGQKETQSVKEIKAEQPTAHQASSVPTTTPALTSAPIANQQEEISDAEMYKMATDFFYLLGTVETGDIPDEIKEAISKSGLPAAVKKGLSQRTEQRETPASSKAPKATKTVQKLADNSASDKENDAKKSPKPTPIITGKGKDKVKQMQNIFSKITSSEKEEDFFALLIQIYNDKRSDQKRKNENSLLIKFQENVNEISNEEVVERKDPKEN